MEDPILQLQTDEDGVIDITAADIPLISNTDLKRWHITRAQLQQLFDEGQELMEGRQPSDRVRPVADEVREGQWMVNVVKYSPLTDPLMHKKSGGTA